jgi:cytochrome P450
MEGKIAINTLLRRIPNIDLNILPSELQWRPSLVARGVMSLPVKFNR